MRHIVLNSTYTEESDGSYTVHVSQVPPNPAVRLPSPFRSRNIETDFSFPLTSRCRSSPPVTPSSSSSSEASLRSASSSWSATAKCRTKPPHPPSPSPLRRALKPPPTPKAAAAPPWRAVRALLPSSLLGWSCSSRRDSHRPFLLFSFRSFRTRFPRSLAVHHFSLHRLCLSSHSSSRYPLLHAH